MRNPFIETLGTGTVTSIVHCYFDRDDISFWPYVNGTETAFSIFHKVPGSGNYEKQIITGNLYESSGTGVSVHSGTGNVFLNNSVTAREVGAKVYLPVFLRSVFPVQQAGSTYLALSPTRRGTSTPLLTLAVADLFANQMGGSVVTVNDPSENAFLGSFRATNLNEQAFSSVYSDMDCGFVSCWNLFSWDPVIGLTDQDHEGDFVWISGEPVTFTRWNSGSTSGNGDFVTFDTAADPLWNDNGLSDKRPIILEVPGTWSQMQVVKQSDAILLAASFNGFRNNAILNQWWDPAMTNWMRFSAPDYGLYAQDPHEWSFYITDNYWGTSSPTLIDAAIHDGLDDVNLGNYVYSPILSYPRRAPFHSWPMLN